MKNYLKVILFVIVTAGVWHFSSMKETKAINALALQNIEALASDESSMNSICIGSGSVDCPITHTKVEYVIQGYSLK